MDQKLKEYLAKVLQETIYKIIKSKQSSTYVYDFKIGDKTKLIVKSWDPESTEIIKTIQSTLQTNIASRLSELLNEDVIIESQTELIKHNEISFTVGYADLIYLPDDIFMLIISYLAPPIVARAGNSPALNESDITNLREVSGIFNSIVTKVYPMSQYINVIAEYPELNRAGSGISWATVGDELIKLNEYDNLEKFVTIFKNIDYVPLNRIGDKIVLDDVAFKYMIALDLINLVRLTIDQMDLLDGKFGNYNELYPLAKSVQLKDNLIFDLIMGYLKEYPDSPELQNIIGFSLVRAFYNANDHAIEVLLQQPKFVLYQEILNAAVHSKNAVNVMTLLGMPQIDPTYNNNIALITALTEANDKLQKIPAQGGGYTFDLKAEDAELTDWSDGGKEGTYMSKNNDNSIVDILLDDPRIDPSVPSDFSLVIACYSGNIQIVRRLLQDPRVNPSSNNNLPITVASKMISEIGYLTPNIYHLILDLIRKNPRFVY